MKQHLPLLFILLVGLVLRLIWLDRIPVGINDDELDYILNAKAIYLTGKDVSGTWSPFSLSTPPNEVPKSELMYLFLSPLVGSLPLSLFWARFPFIIFNLLLITVIYLITKELLGKNVAVISGLVTAINPWSIYFSRTSYEAPVSALFFLFTFYVLLKAEGRKILLALIPAFFAFFTYIGSKIIFLPFLLLSTTYVYLNIVGKKYLKQYILLLILSIFIFLFFIISLPQRSSSARLTEILTPSSYFISTKVDEERKLSIENPVRDLFSNKITVYLKNVISIQLGMLSTDFLFLHGDEKSTFSIWEHGNFYYLDAVFILLGVIALFSKQKKVLTFFVLAIIIATLPSVFSSVGKAYGTRSALAFPFLLIFAAYGIWFLINLYKNKIYKYTVVLFLFLAYSLLLSNFLYIYLFRNPVYNSEGFSFSKRILSKYIDLATDKNSDILVISDAQGLTTPVFKNYIFYSNGYTKENSGQIASLIQKNSKQYKNLRITNCPDEMPAAKTVVIAPFDSNCNILKKISKDSSIAKLSDGYAIYNIFNDRVCNSYSLNRYPAGITFEDLKVEGQKEKDFCGNFITRLE